MKILHLADIHAQEKDMDEITKSLDFIADYARANNPDFTVVAGDIFNSRDVRVDTQSVRAVIRFFEAVASVSPVLVVTGTPSHDGKAPEILAHVNSVYPIKVSTVPEVFLADENGFYPMAPSIQNPVAVLSTVPTPTKQFFKSDADIQTANDDLAQAMTGIFGGIGAEASSYADIPHIMTGHFSVRGAALSETQMMIGRDIEISKDQIAMARPHVVCLGHIHKQQLITPNIFYSGSIYRKDFGEMEEKGFYMHTFSGKTCESEFIEIPTRKLVKIKRNYLDADDFSFTLSDAEKELAPGALVRVELTAYHDELGRVDGNDIERQLKDAGADRVEIKPTWTPRENVRSQNILTLETLRDKLTEQARIRGAEISESVLAKADFLETEAHDELMAKITGELCN